jgi:signal transduction histidine kinase
MIGLAFVIGTFVMTIFLVFLRKRQQHLVKMAELQQEMLRSQIEIQEQTFTAVSQELHDNIGQRLGLIKLQLNTLGMNGAATEQVSEIKEQVTQTITDVRAISKSLHPERIAMLGLIDSVQQALQALQATGQWKTHCLIEGEGAIQKKESEVILFRMVQELMNNAVKHSGGNEFSVMLQFTEKDLTITCADNGRGLKTDATKSIGFTSLQNRAALLKGTISFERNAPSGLRVVIQVPKSNIV